MTQPHTQRTPVTATDVDAFRDHLVAWGRSASTVRSYCNDVLLFLGESTATIENYANEAAGWVTSRRPEWAPSTVNRRLASLNQFADFLGVDGLQNYQRPKPAQNTYNGIDMAAVQDVLARLRDVRLQLTASETQDAYALISLCGAAGLRAGEATAATWEDFEDDSDTAIRLRVHGKGSRDRVVPFPATHYDFLCDFDGPLHGVENVRSGRWIINKTFERAGYPGVESHQLRHAFATAAYDASGDLVMVQRLLGHANVTTTQRYIQTSYEDQAALVAGLGA